LVQFLTFIIGTPILCCAITDLGIFWYCSRDFGVEFVRALLCKQRIGHERTAHLP